MKILACDTQFSLAVRARDNYTCQRCGKVGRVECSHVYSRRHRTIRWDMMNAKALCNGCHTVWHSNPIDSFIWFESKYGIDHVEILREKMNHKIKVPKSEEKEIAAHYRAELKKLDADSSYQIVSYQ